MNRFFESIHYEPLCDGLVRRGPIGPNVSFSDRHPVARDRIFAYFDRLSDRRVGILHGEYAMLTGWLLFDRKGVATVGCIPFHHAPSAANVWNELHLGSVVRQSIASFMPAWEHIPVLRNPAVLADYFPLNCWHFALEALPRLRYFADINYTQCVIPTDHTESAFQLDLLARSIGDVRVLHQQGRVFRVTDPVLAYDSLNADGVRWLRRVTGLAARPGNRRIHIRRSSVSTRPGGGVGNISDAHSFQELLADFGFETVDFGNGEHNVAAQVAMLDGAGLILSAHGAGLAKLAHIEPGVRVVEVISSSLQSPLVMHLANIVGFDYHGLYSDLIDNIGNIVVDMDELRDVIRARI